MYFLLVVHFTLLLYCNVTTFLLYGRMQQNLLCTRPFTSLAVEGKNGKILCGVCSSTVLISIIEIHKKHPLSEGQGISSFLGMWPG